MSLVNLSHIQALVFKELKQILADKSVLIVAFVIPLLLVVLYGAGMRMDVKPVAVALVTDKIDDPISKEIAFAIAGSDYFELSTVNNELDAQKMLLDHDIAAYIVVPPNLSQRALHHKGSIMITLNGSDSQAATAAKSYLEALVLSGPALKGVSRQVSYIRSINAQNAQASGSLANAAYKEVQITTRNWFNEANTSTWYLLSGQLVGVVTLMSAFMCSIVIAREFERGTITGLKATNINAAEFLISKIVPYYLLSILGAVFAILSAMLMYNLPFRGSAILFILTMAVYLYVSVMLGLLISAIAKNQFLASEFAIILSFLPSILLSGAVFDLRAIAPAISFIAHLFPPTYAVESAKICFLSGGSEDIIFKNLFIMLIFAAILSGACYLVLHGEFKRTPPTKKIAATPSPQAKDITNSNDDSQAKNNLQQGKSSQLQDHSSQQQGKSSHLQDQSSQLHEPRSELSQDRQSELKKEDCNE